MFWYGSTIPKYKIEIFKPGICKCREAGKSSIQPQIQARNLDLQSKVETSLSKAFSSFLFFKNCSAGQKLPLPLITHIHGTGTWGYFSVFGAMTCNSFKLIPAKLLCLLEKFCNSCRGTVTNCHLMLFPTRMRCCIESCHNLEKRAALQPQDSVRDVIRLSTDLGIIGLKLATRQKRLEGT